MIDFKKIPWKKIILVIVLSPIIIGLSLGVLLGILQLFMDQPLLVPGGGQSFFIGNYEINDEHNLTVYSTNGDLSPLSSVRAYVYQEPYIYIQNQQKTSYSRKLLNQQNIKNTPDLFIPYIKFNPHTDEAEFYFSEEEIPEEEREYFLTIPTGECRLDLSCGAIDDVITNDVSFGYSCLTIR